MEPVCRCAARLPCWIASKREGMHLPWAPYAITASYLSDTTFVNHQWKKHRLTVRTDLRACSIAPIFPPVFEAVSTYITSRWVHSEGLKPSLHPISSSRTSTLSDGSGLELHHRRLKLLHSIYISRQADISPFPTYSFHRQLAFSVAGNDVSPGLSR
ncbi:hypothetical protein DAEQUDRAFT_61477 [Daedalea quercina L-15889]|uniref:Uncharacterized protein n=1 Tax=Daedalea quercina L-15889 TaxID=1314783 RepID=A0A165SLS4_9APHY|nr:hypothetical protein DAEQUDRAFT_61477 [Daedalea quercina L-15889]